MGELEVSLEFGVNFRLNGINYIYRHSRENGNPVFCPVNPLTGYPLLRG